MRKVMVVDDDYLVRQALIRIMPWAEHGMEVAAEAGSGADALALLERQAVDLLITDLAMPAMSGIELMKQVKERYPRVAMVVLTFHHDFELIRDALRLGALDYITKIELEQDQMGSILQRIRQRIEERAPGGEAETGLAEADRFGGDVAVSLVRRRDASRVWQAVEEAACDLACDPARASAGDVRIRWHGVRGRSRRELEQQLRLHGDRLLFYLLEEGNDRYDWQADWLADEPAPPKDAILKLGRELSGLAWMSDDELFRRLVADAADLRLPAVQLEQMIIMAVQEWSKFIDSPLFRLEEDARPHTWQGWVGWLREVRSCVRDDRVAQVYSHEVTTSILRAAEYLQRDLRSEIQLPAMAEKVHMSRSYFSKCFRDIMGKTFQEYVRDLKIQHAKTLLRRTNKSIGWVAAESGYPNEKYFSKVFRETTGQLPREYRKNAAEVTNRLP